MKPNEYPGVNAVLMGPPGTGKTYALSTLAAAGIETFVLFLEPGLESLVGAFCDPPPHGRGMKSPPSNVHWHTLAAKERSFEEMRAMAEKIGRFDLKALSSYKDIKRSDYNRFEAIYACLNNFVDERTGQSYGPVDKWDNTRAICIDGTTGLGDAAMEMMTGDKPVRDKPDYGIAQTNIKNLVRKLTNDCTCHFVLLAHVERMVDEIMGGVKLMPSTPGRAIQGVITQPFSDVILTKREVDKWHWDTVDSTADLKARNLAYQAKLAPSFEAVIARWKARRDAALSTS